MHALTTLGVVMTAMLLSIVAGCALYAPPKPWEKGDLARAEMQFDADALDAKLEQHVYASKESSTGGYSVGGGGCGCN